MKKNNLNFTTYQNYPLALIFGVQAKSNNEKNVAQVMQKKWKCPSVFTRESDKEWNMNHACNIELLKICNVRVVSFTFLRFR